MASTTWTRGILMADVLQALQFADAPEQSGAAGGVDVMGALAHAGQTDHQVPAAPSPTPTQRFEQGFNDTIMGLGDLTQHAMGPALNVARKAFGLNQVSNSDWDQIVAQREQQYDQARAQAGQTGIDWWRLAGNMGNPVNYMAPGGTAETVMGRLAQAGLQGAGLGAVQAVGTSAVPGQSWWNAATGAATGGLMGGIVGGLVEGVVPALRFALNKVRNLVSDGSVSSSATADQVVKSALNSSGQDPSAVDLNLLKGLRQDVQSALDNGADISPQSVINRAKAESLPVPVQLTRGQATGDPMLYSREMNLRGVQGVGEPLTTRLQQQNSAFIQNLDALGAKNAMDPVSFGAKYAKNIQTMWDGLQAHKTALYDAVRNADGQSVAMDGVSAADNIKAALDTPQASYVYDMLPSNIRRTIDDMGSGQLPFSVAQMQSLDKIWGDAARGVDGSTSYAINQARRILADSPIADDTGEQARQAYFAARQAHAQQMSLIDSKLPNGMPNPNFQPLVKSVVMDGKPPEKLFVDNFMNAAPSLASRNLQFLTQLDQDAPQQIGQTFMGEIKRQALSSASDERGTISESVLRGYANDPVKSAMMDALLPQPLVNTFRNLAATVEAAKRFPVASTVNTSNTGSSIVNAGMSMLKNGALGQVVKHLPLLRGVAEGLEAAKTSSDMQSALNPGVTLKSLMTSTPAQAAKNRLLSRLLTPGAVSYEQEKQRQ